MDEALDESGAYGAPGCRIDAGGHDGFFFLDALSRAELLDVRETAHETRDRACKLIFACEKRLCRDR